MIFKQFYLGCLAHASYLIGDGHTRTAVVVDPRRDVQQYLDEAEKYGLHIRHVFLTHLHADFIAGHLELRDRVGAQIHLGARAEAEYAFTRMRSGDVLEFGRVRLQVLETPGHTPESISILLYDLASEAARPYAVLTGDTLFIGDVGRPDLRASLGWSAVELGRLLYTSLHETLLPLPDETLVYPAHGAGSLCGKHISKDTVSTMGEQRRRNYALQPMSEEAFVALVTADQPDAPSYFTYDAVLNAKERPTLESVLEQELKPLTLSQVIELATADTADLKVGTTGITPVIRSAGLPASAMLRRGLARVRSNTANGGGQAGHAGAQILDVRDSHEFAQGHLAGSINIALSGQYATWAGTLLARERPIVIVAAPGRETEAAVRLGRIGFDNVVGYLHGGMQTLEDRPDLLDFSEQVSAAQLAAVIGKADGPAKAGDYVPDGPAKAGHYVLILDVRTENEWKDQHIEGSVNMPLNRLERQISQVPRDRQIVVHCAAGYRSSIAMSLLKRHGFTRLSELTGGLAAWEAATRPLSPSR